MRLKRINSQNDILEIVQEIGFLPFFENDIEGFSIEENIAPQYWFDGETDGAWEWKGPLEIHDLGYGSTCKGCHNPNDGRG